MVERRYTRQLAGVALGLAYSAAVFLFIGEAATRGLGLLDRLTGTPRDFYQATDHEEMPYRLNAGVSAQTKDYKIQINSLGLRGPEVSQTPPEGVHRILALGDSIIYGQGVPDDATFPAQLERELRSRDRNVEVLNGGVPGFNNAAELVFLRDYGLPLRPSTVILGISLNDFGNTPVISQSGLLTQDRSKRKSDDRVLPESEFLLLIEWLAKYVRGGNWYQAGKAQSDSKKLLDGAELFISNQHRRFYRKPSGPGWKRVRRSLTGIRDLCNSNGIDLWVVLFPEKFQHNETELPQPQQRWLTLCNELNLRCIDLWPTFKATGGDLYEGAQHHTAAGQALAAKTVVEILVRGD